MIIIFDGKLVIYTILDGGAEFPIAYIEKGAIINAHTFLSGARCTVSIKCLT